MFIKQTYIKTSFCKTLNLRVYTYEHIISKSSHDLTCCLLKLSAVLLGFMEAEQEFLEFTFLVLNFSLKLCNL